MSERGPAPNMVPFRDVDNKSVAYGTNPNGPIAPPDSESELLVRPQELDEDSMNRFTATGRPAPKFKASGMASWGGDMFSVPQLLPKRYTDDSIIPAIVTDVVPSQKTVEVESKKKGGLFSKFKGKKEAETDGLGQKKGVTKVVYMPRREYLKYFAKDEKGEYIGTEPYKRWTEEELEAEFGKYKPEVGKK